MFLKSISLCILVAGVLTTRADEEVVKSVKSHDEIANVKTRDSLIDKLFTDYKSENYPENTVIQFGVTLLNVEFDEDHGLMHSHLWFQNSWTDSRLAWDAEKEGVKILRIPPSKVWLPDTTIYNGPDQNMDCAPTNVIIMPTGTVMWVPPCNIKSYCNFTLSSDPYGVQECNMKFGSWTFDGITMGLELYGNKTQADISHFLGGQRYKFTKNVAVREEKFYPCCKEPYLSIEYKFGIQKLPKNQQTCPKV